MRLTGTVLVSLFSFLVQGDGSSEPVVHENRPPEPETTQANPESSQPQKNIF